MVRWLNRYYPERFTGSPDLDQPMDDNKKGSRVLLKKGALDTLEDPLLSASDSLLMHLFFDWLPVEDPDAALACRFSVLNTNNAGGMVELERWESLGIPEAEDTARDARRGLNAIAKAVSATTAAERFAHLLPEDEADRGALVEGGGIALAVGEDERCASWQEGHNRDIGEKRTFDAHDRYRLICAELEGIMADGGVAGTEAAIAVYRDRRKARKEPDVSPATIYRAMAFCRGEIEEGTEGGIGYFRLRA